MLSSSCMYGIRAVIYIASQPQSNNKTGIKQISKDLNLPTPYLAKILQLLARQKILSSYKGPHGGFSLLKDAKDISLLDIIKTIDGDGIFTDCIIYNGTCKCVDKEKRQCTIHDDYDKVRADLIMLFSKKTVFDLVRKANNIENVII